MRGRLHEQPAWRCSIAQRTRGSGSERGKKRRRRAGVAMPRRLRLRPPVTRTVIDSDSGAGADELCNSTSRKNWDLFEEVTFIYLLQKLMTEFVSFILTKCGINVKRKVVLLLDLLF